MVPLLGFRFPYFYVNGFTVALIRYSPCLYCILCDTVMDVS